MFFGNFTDVAEPVDIEQYQTWCIHTFIVYMCVYTWATNRSSWYSWNCRSSVCNLNESTNLCYQNAPTRFLWCSQISWQKMLVKLKAAGLTNGTPECGYKIKYIPISNRGEQPSQTHPWYHSHHLIQVITRFKTLKNCKRRFTQQHTRCDKRNYL